MDFIVKRFKDLSKEELYEILRCRAEVFIVEQKIPYQDIDHVDEYSTHVFAMDGDRLVTYLRVIDPGVKCDSASIGRVLVMKDYRGRGIARRLMRKGMEIALEISPEIEISAQPYLHDFYQSLGFTQTSDIFIYGERPHIRMKFLPPIIQQGN